MKTFLKSTDFIYWYWTPLRVLRFFLHKKKKKIEEVFHMYIQLNQTPTHTKLHCKLILFSEARMKLIIRNSSSCWFSKDERQISLRHLTLIGKLWSLNSNHKISSVLNFLAKQPPTWHLVAHYFVCSANITLLIISVGRALAILWM